MVLLQGWHLRPYLSSTLHGMVGSLGGWELDFHILHLMLLAAERERNTVRTDAFDSDCNLVTSDRQRARLGKRKRPQQLTPAKASSLGGCMESSLQRGLPRASSTVTVGRARHLFHGVSSLFQMQLLLGPGKVPSPGRNTVLVTVLGL